MKRVALEFGGETPHPVFFDENEKEVNRSLEQQFINKGNHLQTALYELMKTAAAATTVTSRESKKKKSHFG